MANTINPHGWTNDSHRATGIGQLYDLGIQSNYAITTDEPQSVVLDNVTAPLDQQEILSIRRSKVKSVNTQANITSPAPVRSGVSYAYQWESVVTETFPDGTMQQHPIKMYLTLIHEQSGAISDSVLNEGLLRLLSSIPFTVVTDGGASHVQFNFMTTARGALRPSRDY